MSTLDNLDAQGLAKYEKYLTKPVIDFSQYADIDKLQELINSLSSSVPSTDNTMKLELATLIAGTIFKEHYVELSKLGQGSGLNQDILASALEYNASKGTLSGFDLYKSVLDRLGYSSYVSDFEVQEMDPFKYRLATDIANEHIRSTFHVQHPVGMMLEIFNSLVLNIQELYSTTTEVNITSIACDSEDITNEVQVIETSTGTRLSKDGLTCYLDTEQVKINNTSTQSGEVDFFETDFGIIDIQSRYADVEVQVQKLSDDSGVHVTKAFLQGKPGSDVELTITTSDRQTSDISYTLGDDTTFQQLDLNTVRRTLTRLGYRPVTVKTCVIDIIRNIVSVASLVDTITDNIVIPFIDDFNIGPSVDMLDSGLSTVSPDVFVQSAGINDNIAFNDISTFDDTLTNVYKNLDEGLDTTSGIILQGESLVDELTITSHVARWKLDEGYYTTSEVTVS